MLTTESMVFYQLRQRIHHYSSISEQFWRDLNGIGLDHLAARIAKSISINTHISTLLEIKGPNAFGY